MSLTNTLNTILESSGNILPEICLAIGGLLMLILELVYPNKLWKTKTSLHLLILLLTAYLVNSSDYQSTSFNGFLIKNETITFFKYLFLLTTGGILFFPKTDHEIRNRGEYHFLLLTMLLGGFLLMQSQNLLVFFLSLELVSISAYILTTFSFDGKGYEAGIKYLLFGALSTAVMLYGISLLYGLTGSLNMEDLMPLISSEPTILGWLGLLFFGVGLLFKISLVPMHIWAPDVYQASPTSVVAVFSVIPKLAALIFLYHLVNYIQVDNINWTNLLSVIAILSMFIGNLSALRQKNAKRMMAYSSIAHAGFLLIAVVVHSEFSRQSLLFYGVVYALSNVGVFYFIHIMEGRGLSDMNQYVGIGRKIPWLGVSVLILMISLIGLPPTAGFTAKLLMFTALWDFYTINPLDALFWLFFLGLINTAIALFYYLKIPYFMFFKGREKSHEMIISMANRVLLLVICAVLLIIFFKADWLIS